MMPMFVASHDPLTADKVRRMWEIEWSEEGSNNREKEEDTMYSFELFLDYCES